MIEEKLKTTAILKTPKGTHFQYTLYIRYTIYDIYILCLFSKTQGRKLLRAFAYDALDVFVLYGQPDEKISSVENTGRTS